MSAQSSEEGSRIMDNYAISSGLESTGSLLFSVVSDVQTEMTPPTSPTPSESKMRTPRDFLDASRRLGQISSQGNETPAKPKRPKQVYHRVPRVSVNNEETGYDADGDGDGDEGILRTSGAGTTATRSIRRPMFLRIDTRQRRRVASMLATRRSSPSFDDSTDARQCLPRTNLKFGTLFPAGRMNQKSKSNTECYELRKRQREDPGLVGLGIGFPENHPLRDRAFSVPVPMPAAVSPRKVNPSPEVQQQVDRRCEWFSSLESASPPTASANSNGKQYNKTQKPVRVDTVDVCAPRVRPASRLRPTSLEVSPSPIEFLSGTSVDCYDPDDVLAGIQVQSTRSGLEVGEGQGDGNRGRSVSMGYLVRVGG